jgi:hypothetical protein
MGPPSGLPLLRSAPALAKMNSDFALAQQKLKAYITNKSLRGLNSDTLDQIFPNSTSVPSVNDYKINNLLDTVRREQSQYANDLTGKIIPPGLQAGAMTTDQQNALKTATAPPPGMKPGIAPDGKGGWKGIYVKSGNEAAARQQGAIIP